MDINKLSSVIRDIPDFPVKGIIFKDITPVLQDIELFNDIVCAISDKFKDKKIDGAIGVRDSIAISFMNIAQENGRQIPEDISVAGFQNTKYAVLSRPNLTSLDIPVYDIGAVAMRLLTKLMNQEDVGNSLIILPHHIIKRSSTRK